MRVLRSLVLAGILAMCAVSLKAADSDVAEQVVHTPFFPQPLAWVGTQCPGESESRALLKDADVFRNKGVAAGMASLEGFLKEHPDSAWAPTLEVNLAEHYRNQGRYSSALALWEAAWKATCDTQDAAGQKIAVRSMAGWTKLLASLGEKEKLNALFKELGARHLRLGIYHTSITETREGLAMMNTRPGDAYRCGSLALGHVALALGMDKQVAQKFFDADSPNGGFTVSELLALAKSNDMAVLAVRQPPGAELVVPSVVHWKLNHYAAILEKKGDLYKVEDPTFGGHQWMTAETIEAESSGNFILPAGKAPGSWEKLSEVACAKIYGKGYVAIFNDWDDDGPPDSCDGGGDGDEDSDDSNCNPPASNDGSSSGSSPPNCPECQDDDGSPDSSGMPQWSISEPYTTLWLRDTPLIYHQSDKKWMRLKLTYKGRGEAQNPNEPGFGDKWSCNWFGMLQTPSGVTDTVTNFLAGGGARPFKTDGTPEYKTVRRFMNVGGAIMLVTPPGAENSYELGVTYLDGTKDNLVTEHKDRYGRLLQQFLYGSTTNNILQLSNVLDADEQTISISCTNTNFPNLITSVTDPYGRSANFIYSGGVLTTIVDAQGMTSSFEYDSNEDITAMTTPYGTTTFTNYETGDGTNTPVYRGTLITEASGDQQLYVFLTHGIASAPGDVSYHWNRAAYASISNDWSSNTFNMPAEDFSIAPIKYWLLGDNTDSGGFTFSDTSDRRADAYDPAMGMRPNQFTYTYQGENGTHIGDPTNGYKRVVDISIFNPGLSQNQHRMEITRNNLGRPTSYTYLTSDSIVVYTNVFDSTGTILQYQLGPQGELTRGYGYDATINNLLVSVTNAVGDVIRYTHDPTSLKVTGITFPGGLVRANTYYTSGPSKGFLAVQADIGFRTNYYVYTNGNLFIQTNELGLVTTHFYDKLNRLLATAYPDGTTVSNIYDKLDIVATKDRLNQWTYFGYNAVRQLMAVTNVNGQITQYAYCGCGSPDQITRWNGSTPLVTTLSYNVNGLVTNAVYPDGYQLSYGYDFRNRMNSISDGAGNQLSASWWDNGVESQLQSISLGGVTTLSRQFDQYGRVLVDQDRSGVETTNAYDLVGRLTARAFVGGGLVSGVESFSYNAVGLTNYFDQLGHLTTFVRDLAGRVTAETNGNKEVLQFAYNPASELLTLTDGKNQATQWSYDPFGRVTNKVDASATTDFIYQYDPDNRLTNRWTPAKGTTVFRYDPMGNLTNVDYSGGTVSTPSISFTYDGVNRLTNMLDGIGRTVFTWTPGDQLAGELGPWHDSALSYTYNNARQRSGLGLLQPTADAWTQSYTSYDSQMRLQTLVSPAGEFDYSYAACWRVGQVTLPALSSFVRFSYDGLARVSEAQLAAQQASEDLLYYYDAGSEVTQKVYNLTGNYINYTYDDIGQLKSGQGFEGDGTTRLQEQWGYGYDKAWNLNNRTNNALVQTFSVNNLNELSGASRSGTLTVAGSTTEPNNISSVTVNGLSATEYGDGTFAKGGFTLADGANTFTASATDSSRSDSASVTAYLPASPSYTYDSNGNLTSDGARSFAYDDENQLTAVWVASAWSNRFVYDGLMRKRAETNYSWSGSSWVETNETRYIYDGYLVLQERDANDLPVTTYTRGLDLSGTFQGAGGIGGLLARSDRMSVIPYVLSPGSANPQNIYNSYYFSDAQGNVTALISQSGMLLAQYEYDPYGNVVSMSGLMAGANKYRFSSKEWGEAAGLYYYGFRFYDPSLQRWVNRDPIQEEGGLNLFNFVGNAPSINIDPIGLDCDGGMGPGSANPENLKEVADLEKIANGMTEGQIERDAAREAAKDALKMTDKEARATLRNAMETPKGEAANHNIPWAERDNPLVEKAADGGWNINGAKNGTNLPNELHSGWKNWNEWHKFYNDLAKKMLDHAWAKNPNMSSQEAAQTAQKIADALSKFAKQSCGVK